MAVEKTFGETIKEIRQNEELTLKEVAIRLKIDTSLLSKIEKNQRKPSKQFIKDFSDTFHINERELMISFLSDCIVYSIREEEFGQEALKVAESKMNYMKKSKINTQCN